MTRHITNIAVRFYELDPYDHVNHAVYLSYFETARIEALESVGMGLHSLSERGFRIVVSDLNLKFHAPAKAGDSLEIETLIVDMKRVTHGWQQHMSRSGTPIASLDLRAAMTNLDGRPTRIPSFFKGAWSGE